MKGLLKPFYRTGLWIAGRIPEKRWGKGEERLRALYPGESCSVREYYGKRLAVVLAVLFWGIGGAVFVQIGLEGAGETTSCESLDRPEYGGGSRETELLAQVDGEAKEARVSVSIREQEYTPEETRQIFREITAGLEEAILGENGSLEQVRSDLVLPETLYGGAVTVEWLLSPGDVLDGSGAVIKEVEDAGEVVELRALLRYREQEAEYTCYAHVYPPVRTERELLEKQLKEAVGRADMEGRYENRLTLPSEVDGRRILWSRPEAHEGLLIALLALAGAVLLWFHQEQELEKRERQRKRQLILDYPEILFKMAMLLGAGLTIRAAFEKIAEEYRKRKQKNPRYVYEEMLCVCREMENGLGEAAAYEAFGKRCQDARYIKLGSVLSQSLRKGVAGLPELLEREAAAGFEERKQTARKLGEEAGTKLLFPMMLMLGLILVILMVPAVFNFM